MKRGIFGKKKIVFFLYLVIVGLFLISCISVNMDYIEPNIDIADHASLSIDYDIKLKSVDINKKERIRSTSRPVLLPPGERTIRVEYEQAPASFDRPREMPNANAIVVESAYFRAFRGSDGSITSYAIDITFNFEAGRNYFLCRPTHDELGVRIGFSDPSNKLIIVDETDPSSAWDAEHLSEITREFLLERAEKRNTKIKEAKLEAGQGK